MRLAPSLLLTALFLTSASLVPCHNAHPVIFQRRSGQPSSTRAGAGQAPGIVTMSVPTIVTSMTGRTPADRATLAATGAVLHGAASAYSWNTGDTAAATNHGGTAAVCAGTAASHSCCPGLSDTVCDGFVRMAEEARTAVRRVAHRAQRNHDHDHNN